VDNKTSDVISQSGVVYKAHHRNLGNKIDTLKVLLYHSTPSGYTPAITLQTVSIRTFDMTLILNVWSRTVKERARGAQ